MSGEEPRPGNWDRAWNDPPLFNYQQGEGEAAPPTAGKLNKRVGFPGSGTAPPLPPTGGATAGLPPPPIEQLSLHDAGAKSVGASMPPPPPPAATTAGATHPPTAGVSSPVREEPVAAAVDVDTVVRQLNEALERSSLEEKRKQDVLKRIKMMETKWRSGGLNDQVHARMGKVAASLAEGDGAAAERVQLSLSVDWPALCGTWMIGLKHLVLNVKENQKGTEGDKEEKKKVIDKPL